MPDAYWHSPLESVYHAHPHCKLGQQARCQGALPGKGGKTLCEDCQCLTLIDHADAVVPADAERDSINGIVSRKVGDRRWPQPHEST